MSQQTLYLWKQAPFLRLLVPLAAGILLQWYCNCAVTLAWSLFCLAVSGLVVFNLRVSFLQFKHAWATGLFIHIIFIGLGMLVTWYSSAMHAPLWLGKQYKDNAYVTVTLVEPLSEKANSYKATAAVQQLLADGLIVPVTGNVIIYFKKDSAVKQLGCNSRLLFKKTLQPIKNSGNPGSFDYERYAAFHGIYHQVFIGTGDYVVLPGASQYTLNSFLFAARQKVLNVIKAYIPGQKEAGLAEALLVGYKDDLDKTLVQSYSNTGVVHIIAISGMHLGLIYWLLNILLQPLSKKKQTRWLLPVLIITGLWLFALLTGGGPSILRSAVMFTCIVIGNSLERKTFIYNSLAAAAFILLCINPFWLWDAGFQLSFTAVLSIVIFSKPVNNWLFFPNKILAAAWNLAAVTIAAQILTTPVSMYHFHQFPVYFLITNLLAIPLSSIIVLLEIGLCSIGWIPMLAKPGGMILHWLITCMNGFIEHMENLPLSLWGGMQLNILQLVLLYGLVAALACWLMQKNKPAFFTSLLCLLGFFCLRSWSFISAGNQQQLIVYNVPRHQSIDFIDGRNYRFMGDDSMLADVSLQNFYLRPSRVLHRAVEADSLPLLLEAAPLYVFNNKKIVLIDSNYRPRPGMAKVNADLLILSKNAPVQLPALLQIFNCKQVVLDGSNSLRKVNNWKASAAKLGLHCFSVVDKGAFVMNTD